jgi:hypothetical protein
MGFKILNNKTRIMTNSFKKVDLKPNEVDRKPNAIFTKLHDDYYYNVTRHFYTPLKIYTVWNGICTFVHLLLLFYKLKKGIFAKLKLFPLFHQAVTLFILLWLFWVSFEVRTGICFCKYQFAHKRFTENYDKAGKMTNKKDGTDLDDYICLKNGNYIDGLLFYETIFTGIFFAIIFYHHLYKNLNIKVKSTYL